MQPPSQLESTHQCLYLPLVAHVHSLSSPIKQALFEIYEAFSNGMTPKRPSNQPSMTPAEQQLVSIHSSEGVVTSCFGCYGGNFCADVSDDRVSDGLNNNGLNNKAVTKDRTEHVVRWETGQLYAWCIWDAFFITKIIGKPATISSIDPVSQQRITISFDGTDFDKNMLWFSFPLGEMTQSKSIRACFCCRTKAFVSEVHAKQFAKKNDCEVVTMDQMLERTDLMVNALSAA